LNTIDGLKQPITVDVKWVTENYMIKPSLQSNLRKNGILPFSIVKGTTKILYKKIDVENIITSKEVQEY